MREWLTTMPNPTVIGYGPDQGQRGWRLHYVETGTFVYERINGEKIDKSPALCGLTPAHGWGLDMFIIDRCKRCEKALERQQPK